MKYNIISINDDRADYKAVIRERVHVEEVDIPAVNGNEVDVSDAMAERGLKMVSGGMNTRGEFGVWLSTFDCWQWAVDNDEELIVFEDDAIPSKWFKEKFTDLYHELPRDYDFMTLWVPPNQYVDYVYNATYDDAGQMTQHMPNKNAITSIYNVGKMRIARAYNGYGNVAQLYSPAGAAKFIAEAQQNGMYTTVDCFIYLQSHLKRVNGFAPKPNYSKVVDYDWEAETTVRTGERL